MILLSLLFSAAAAFAKGGNIVGNGGDGFYDGHRVYVRDLWEAGAYQPDPWIGEKADSALPMATIESRMSDVGVSGELLRRKLTDVNTFRPGLGDALVKVIESYAWRLTNDPIELPPGYGGIGEALAPPPGQRVQLAVRNFSMIKIRNDWWKLMTPEDRVGLVLHEAITSLLPIQCVLSICEQDQTYYRISVGTLFAEVVMNGAREYENSRDFILSSFKNAFSIPLEAFQVSLKIGGEAIAISSSDQSSRLEAVCERPLSERMTGEISPPEVQLIGGYYFDADMDVLDYRNFVRSESSSAEARRLTGVSKQECVNELREWIREARARRLAEMSPR